MLGVLFLLTFLKYDVGLIAKLFCMKTILIIGSETVASQIKNGLLGLGIEQNNIAHLSEIRSSDLPPLVNKRGIQKIIVIDVPEGTLKCYQKKLNSDAAHKPQLYQWSQTGKEKIVKGFQYISNVSPLFPK